MLQKHLVGLGWGHILGIIYHIENPENGFVPIAMSKSLVPADSWVTSIPDPMSLWDWLSLSHLFTLHWL